MKKIKLFLAAVAAMVSLGVSATDWTGSPVGAGTFYLYNVGAEQFVGYGANWGTRAIVDPVGIPVTLEANTDGTYKIKTNVTGSGYLGADFYVDQAACNFTITPVEGMVNVYTLVYTPNDGTPRYRNWVTGATNFDQVRELAAGSTWTLESLYWMFISKDERDAAFASGTPCDITYKYIPNHNTAYFTGCFSTNNPWQGTALGGFNGRDAGGTYRDRNTEHYNKTYDTYIQATDVPAGKYRFSMAGFYRDGLGEAAIANYKAGTSTLNAKIYANSDETPIQSIGVGMRETKAWDGANESSAEVDGTTYYVPNNQEVVTFYFNEGLYPLQSVETVVTDGNLKFGMKKESTITYDWTLFDKFRLEYVDPAISAIAIAIPTDGNLIANQWYVFNIDVEGEYTINSNNLEAVVYTTSGNSILKSEEGTVNATFSQTQELTVGTYYVKSSENNTLKVVPNVKTYVVGTPTAQTFADGNTVVAVNTFVVTYGEAATNDEESVFQILNGSAKATLKKGNELIAEGTLSADADAKTLTATFPETTLEIGVVAYSLSIPAGVVGYNAEAQNTAINLNIVSPLIPEGKYFVQNTADKRFLSRGGNYGTEATVDLFGVGYGLESQPNGTYLFKNIEHSLSANADLYLNGTTSFYTDQAGGTGYTLEPTEGGYFIKADGKYLTCSHHQNETRIYDYLSVTENVSEAKVWKLLSKSEYSAELVAIKNAEIATIANSANISVVNTSELETVLADRNIFSVVDKTSSIKNPTCAAEDGSNWTAVSTCENLTFATNSEHKECAEIWNNAGSLQQTISNLPEGIYRVTVNATTRPGDMNAGRRVGAEANAIAWLFANTASEQNVTQLVPWYTVDNTVNARSSFVAKVNADNNNYLNTVYVYVAEGEDLTLGVSVPNFCNQPWTPIYNFTLTHFSTEVSSEDVESLIASIPTGAMSKANKEAIAYAKEALEANSTIANYNALSEAIEAAAPSIALYQNYSYYLAAFNANIDGSADESGVQSKYDAGTIESVDAMIADYRTYALNTLATDKLTDYTSIIINPGFEVGPFLTSGNVTGWEVATDGREAFASNSNSSRKFEPGYTGSGLFNTWTSSSVAENSYILKQNFGVLPAGQYRLTGYIASGSGTHTVNVGNGSASVDCSSGSVGVPVAVVFTSDGQTATQFSITDSQWFKADDFQLFLIGDGSEVDLSSTIAAAEAKILGFEVGEYAPYNNVEPITALANLKAVAQATIGSYEVEGLSEIAAVGDDKWTVNTEKMNAIFDGSFEYSYSHEGNVQPIGWNGVGDKDNASNVRYMWNYESNAGLNAASNKTALFAKFTALYGTQTGYTLPLKAGVYSLSFVYGGWNETGTREIRLYNADNNSTILPTATVTAKDNKAHTTPESWQTYNAKIVVPADGDYILSFYRENTSNQNQIVLSDIELFSVDKSDVTLAVTDAKWATFIAPFDVEIPAGVTAYGVSEKNGNSLTLADVETTIPANTPVILYSDTKLSEVVSGQNIATADSYTVGWLTGVYKATPAIIDTYIMQKHENNVGFFKVETEGITTIQPNRAYLTVPAEEQQNVKSFILGDIADAIQSVMSGVAAGEIYDLGGRKVSKMQKGNVYIVNGKKVAVK